VEVASGGFTSISFLRSQAFSKFAFRAASKSVFHLVTILFCHLLLQESSTDIVELKEVEPHAFDLVMYWVYEYNAYLSFKHHGSCGPANWNNILHIKCLFAVFLVADRLLMNELLTVLYERFDRYFEWSLWSAAARDEISSDDDAESSTRYEEECRRRSVAEVNYALALAEYLEQISNLPEQI
jgi:hypothetical protein